MKQKKQNLTKRDIIIQIYEKTKFPQKQIRDTVQQTLDIISEALIDLQNVELRKFGVLEVQLRKRRIGRNPNEPEKDVIIPDRFVVKFKAGKELKESLKRIKIPFSQKSESQKTNSSK